MTAASFTEILTASAEGLVDVFYPVKPAPVDDMMVQIEWAATQLQLNHTQLVCALGFNRNIRNLNGVLSLIGCPAYAQLAQRRDELFDTDSYEQLSIDNVLDIYSERLEDAELLDALRELLPSRLTHIEEHIGRTDNPAYVVSYKMEVHAIYNGGIATSDFARRRLEADIGQYRLLSGEAELVAETGLASPSHIMFTESVLSEEKQQLIENGLMPSEVIRRRVGTEGVPAEEKEMLSNYLA